MNEGAEVQRRSMVLLKNQHVDNRNLLPLSEGINIYIEQIERATAAQYANIVDTPEQADIALIRLQTPFEVRSDNYVEQFFHQGSLAFNREEINRLTDIAKTVPTVFFIYMDRPPVMPEINAAATAVVAEFGAFDGAVLDIAFGRSKPQGRLPFEIPSSMEAVESQYEDVPYDSKNPLYPYGHGLSY
jgi:beta-glucosidase